MGFWARVPAGLVVLGRDGREIMRVGTAQRPRAADELTGLLGREAFLEAAGRELARVRRGGLPGCVAVLDLDGLKGINDAFGHDVGDQIIVQVAQVVTGFCRAADLVGRGGGDELWLLLPATENDAAVLALERLSAKVPDHVRRPDGVGVTASIGLARLDSATHRVDAAVEHAVSAAYAAKVRAPGQVAMAGKDLFTALRSEWEDLNRDATVDPRTGLGNPRAFERDWAQRHTAGGRYGLVLVDVDHFHAYNRAHGMRAGDETLAAVATALAETVRKAGRPYRYGGEEFVVLADASGSRVDMIGREIVQAVRELARPHDDRPDGRRHVTVTAAGVTVDPERDDRLAAFNLVDDALIDGKAAGRDRYMVPEVDLGPSPPGPR